MSVITAGYAGEQKLDQALLSTYKIKDILSEIFIHLDKINKFITDTKPWTKEINYLNGQPINYICCMRTILEAIYIISHFLYPFIPSTIDKLIGYMNTNLKTINQITWINLNPGKKINPYEILFQRI